MCVLCEYCRVGTLVKEREEEEGRKRKRFHNMKGTERRAGPQLGGQKALGALL